MKIFLVIKILFEASKLRLHPLKRWEEWISIFFKTGETLWLLPLRWDVGLKSLKISTKRLQISICAFGIVYNITRAIYSIYVMTTVSFTELGRDEVVALLIDGVSRAFGILVYFWQLTNLDGSVNMFNQVYGLHQKYKGT